MAQLRRVALVALAILAMSGCEPSADFETACSALEPGATYDDVDARLEAVGAHHTMVGESDVWARESLLHEESCEIDFGARQRLRAARYHRER